MSILLRIYKLSLQIVNFFFKIIPRNEKFVLFLSRQGNEASIDFQYMIEDMRKRYPKYQVKVLTKRMEKTNVIQIICYVFHPFVQLFYLAKASICIIDGYQMAISCVHHKKGLKIVQIWHSLGAVKKFGYQTLNTKRDQSWAKIMNMHKQYDVIVSSSEAMRPYFSQAFGYPEDKFIVCGLPRVDYLKNTVQENRKKVYELYPELKKEKVVLYVPTFRTYDEYKIDELIQAFEESDYKLIIKIHPRMKIIVDKKYTYDAVTSLELLSIADVVISDYSAISIEAAILNRPVLLYIYDEERYNKIEGINTNLYEDLKGYVFKESEALVDTINKGNYDRNVLKAYREKYVVEQESATKALVDAILKDVK